MPLTADDKADLSRLRNQLQRDCNGTATEPGFKTLDRYYDGTQVLRQLGLAVPAELDQFTTIVAWPGVYADTVVERNTVQGFRLAGEPEVDDDLWRIWQANDMDSEFPLSMLDSVVDGRGYLCMGAGADENTPRITVESPLEVTHTRDPRTRTITRAARFYRGEDGSPRATLYRPYETLHAVQGSAGWSEATEAEYERDEHGLDDVPVEVMTNRARTGRRGGQSQFFRIIGITDAAARALTLEQVATEIMALPQRTAAGVSQADFVDAETGRPTTKWETYFGSVWATANKDARFHQFDAADLSNFTKVVEGYAGQVSGMTGLPGRYLGLATQNPPSADGIRADESRIILTAENTQRLADSPIESMQRRALRYIGRDDSDAARGMETLWRDAGTPTRGMAADAAVKLNAQGIVPLRQTRRDLGYSSVQIQNMEAEDDEAQASDPLLRAAQATPRPRDTAAALAGAQADPAEVSGAPVR